MRKSIVFALILFGTSISAQIPTARQQVLAAMRARPHDPWPRGAGHVLLAVPGSEDMQKSYHEPGGSFSPVVKSFGVSIWITSTDGAVVKTSDSIPLSSLKQKLLWRKNTIVPSLSTETDEYQSTWSIGPQNGTYSLALSASQQNGHKMALAIRSVGPAGDAIETLAWDGHRMRVNGRFVVTLKPAPAAVYVGPEDPGWTTAQGGDGHCSGHGGWCYARIELPGKGDYTLSIQDLYPRPVPALTAASTRSSLDLDLPDQRFAEALDAQVAQLMMSLVSDQTRGGEPVNYPQPWIRDGGWVLVALARAGRLETARELVPYFAENDFFGGFGAEGDAPGFSLWAITEVAVRARDKDFDAYLWPHVRRKAEFALGLMSTKEAVERFSIQPIVPAERTRPEIYEVAKPAADGLVSGRMDHATRPLFTSAITYRGLVLASEFARRVGQNADAERWRAAATQLQEAWLRKYTPDDRDERTFMCGLFPTWIAAPKTEEYEAGLRKHWKEIWHPEKGGLLDAHAQDMVTRWTYFNFEHANNWLYTGHIDPVWKTLNWFWDNQPSPGLYTWWEGNGEENAYHQWDYVRGWVNPPHVTPHYQSAAAHLLLQLDMLSYVDESSDRPSLVIGAGVPAEWCKHTMKAHGMLTKIGAVDWDWNGKKMTVKVRGEHCPVRLGPEFPKDAKLSVEYPNE